MTSFMIIKINYGLFGYITPGLIDNYYMLKNFFLNLIIQSFFLSILSKHEEHNR